MESWKLRCPSPLGLAREFLLFFRDFISQKKIIFKTRIITSFMDQEIPPRTKWGVVWSSTLPTLKTYPYRLREYWTHCLAYTYSQVLTEPVTSLGSPVSSTRERTIATQDDSSGPTIHSHRFDCNWLKMIITDVPLQEAHQYLHKRIYGACAPRYKSCPGIVFVFIWMSTR